MPMTFFSLFDGCDQSFGDTAEGDGIDGGLAGKYSSHSIGRHMGVVGGEDARHLVGGWRVRRRATGGFVRHVGIGHGGIEDVKNDAADM